MKVIILDNIKTFIDENYKEMINDIKKLIKIESILQDPFGDAPFGEPLKKVLELMLEICKQKGLKTHNLNNYVGYADWGDNPKLGILSHLDVVPVSNGWKKTEPFNAVVIDDKLYGRGAVDDKGPAIASLYALLSVISTGAKPNGGVRLIFGTDEETAHRDIEYYCKYEKMPPAVFTPDAFYPIINVEKGLVQIHLQIKVELESKSDIIWMHGGKAVNVVPQQSSVCLSNVSKEEIQSLINEDKSGCSFIIKEENPLIIECIGKASHAKDPQLGKNSLVALMTLISKLSINTPRFTKIRELLKLFPYDDFYGENIGVYAEDPDSGKSSILFSMLDIDDSGMNCGIDLRFPISTTLDYVYGKVKENLNRIGFVETKSFLLDSHSVDKNSNFIKSLLEVYDEVTGLKGECNYSGGLTYAHTIEGAVTFGPMQEGYPYNYHSDDEFIPIDHLKLSVELQAKSILKIAAK